MIRYIKGTKNLRDVSDSNFTKDLRKIVGEAINIHTGITYFKNGKLTGDRKKHNIIENDYMIKEVVPTHGEIFMLFPSNANFTSKAICAVIKRIHNDLYDELTQEKLETCIPTGIYGTTQYTLIKKVQNEVVIYSDENKNKIDTFHWKINLLKGHCDYIDFLEHSKVYNVKYIAQIIYDAVDIFDLPNEHRSIEPLSLSDLHYYKQKFVWNDLLCVNKHGIRYHVYKTLWPKISKINNSCHNNYNYERFNYNSNLLHWIKWENIKPRKITNTGQLFCSRLNLLPYHIKNNIVKEKKVANEGKKVKKLKDKKKLKDEKDEKEAHEKEAHEKNEEKDTFETDNYIDYRCAFSGMYISGDCYVLDIYRQKVFMKVSKSDVLPSDKSITRAKFDEQVYFINKYFNGQFPYDMINVVYVNEEKEQKIKDPTYVIRMVEYKEPVHLLISPEFLISYLGDKCEFLETIRVKNSFLYICRLFKFDAILYRSYYSRPFSDVIDKMPIDDFSKEILNAFNGDIKLFKDKSSTIVKMTTEYQNKKYTLARLNTIMSTIVSKVRAQNEVFVVGQFADYIHYYDNY